MTRTPSERNAFIDLTPFSKTDELHVIIDTPKGSRNKYKYDAEYQLFTLGGVLPAGAVFPFDFGYVPSTEGGDGDPLDVLVLMDEPVFVGCLVRLILKRTQFRQHRVVILGQLMPEIVPTELQFPRSLAFGNFANRPSEIKNWAGKPVAQLDCIHHKNRQ